MSEPALSKSIDATNQSDRATHGTNEYPPNEGTVGHHFTCAFGANTYELNDEIAVGNQVWQCLGDGWHVLERDKYGKLR